MNNARQLIKTVAVRRRKPRRVKNVAPPGAKIIRIQKTVSLKIL